MHTFDVSHNKFQLHADCFASRDRYFSFLSWLDSCARLNVHARVFTRTCVRVRVYAHGLQGCGAILERIVAFVTKGQVCVRARSIAKTDNGPVEIQLISPYINETSSLHSWNRTGSEKVTNEVSREFRYEARSPRD